MCVCARARQVFEVKYVFYTRSTFTLKWLHFKCSGASFGCRREPHRSESSSSLLPCRRGAVIRKPSCLPGGGRRWWRRGAREVALTAFWGSGSGGRRAARASLRALSLVERAFSETGKKSWRERFGWRPPWNGELQLHCGDLTSDVLSSLPGGDARHLCLSVRSAELALLGSRSWISTVFTGEL